TTLFDQFPPITTEQWMEVAQRDLKGSDVSKLTSLTLDGITLKPFYRSEDLPASTGEAVRGETRQPHLPALREEIREPDINLANTHAI
ncbi:hypothetical protein ABTN30_20155, partial [Acinetobacter baumannii]